MLLRGARQVGKTTLIRQFGKQFANYIELNLEKPADKRFFEGKSNVKQIIESIFLQRNIDSDYSETLLFIDEIQEYPQAVGLLRYFYEDLPQLPVISAGSLLEFSLGDVQNFPVGRIRYAYLFPLNFDEYLEAIEYNKARTHLHTIPLKPIAHEILLDLFHTYVIIGGMPEIVKTFLQNDKFITALPRVYESIWNTYADDIEKYGKNNTARHVLRHIFATAPFYIDQRIKFQNFGHSSYRSREVKEAFRSLDMAKVIQLIYPTGNVEPPVIPDIRKFPKLQFLDTGLVNHLLKIQSQLIGLEDLNTAYKGKIIPHILTQELLSLNDFSYHKPNFWIRDKKQSSAEVDLVYMYKDLIIPIEIKSGKTGILKSLQLFVDKCPHPYAIRIYAGQFKIEKQKTPSGKPYLLMNMPYYLGTKIPEYISYFIENYQL